MGPSFLRASLTLCSLSFFGSYWSPRVPGSELEPVLKVCALSIMDLLDAGPDSAWCLAKVTAEPQTSPVVDQGPASAAPYRELRIRQQLGVGGKEASS